MASRLLFLGYDFVPVTPLPAPPLALTRVWLGLQSRKHMSGLLLVLEVWYYSLQSIFCRERNQIWQIHCLENYCWIYLLVWLYLIFKNLYDRERWLFLFPIYSGSSDISASLTEVIIKHHNPEETPPPIDVCIKMFLYANFPYPLSYN